MKSVVNNIDNHQQNKDSLNLVVNHTINKQFAEKQDVKDYHYPNYMLRNFYIPNYEKAQSNVDNVVYSGVREDE